VRPRLLATAAALALALAAGGCTSFSSYQTARLVAPRQLSLAAAVAYASHYRGVATAQEPSGFSGRAVAIEGLVRFGLTPRLEAGLKLGHDRSYGTIETSIEQGFVDLKYSILPDQLAVALPVGGTRDHGEFVDLQTQPGLIWTAALGRRLELDSALKLVLIKTRGQAELESLSVAAVVGVRLRSDHHRFELHPELGVMFHDLTNDGVAFGDSIVLGAGLAIAFTP
jgi:hypothetical protein